jgi:hypothetical protein
MQPVLDQPVGQPPSPWKLAGGSAVGGLSDVGFAPGSDLLLVVSSQGRGVFDCLTGERVARDRSVPEGASPDWQDPFELWAVGIGPLAGQHIRTAGLSGGGLSVATRDGWSVERLALEWPDETLLLRRGWGFGYRPDEIFKIAVHSEVRAWGFSPTGRSLVYATSSDLAIWSRS